MNTEKNAKKAVFMSLFINVLVSWYSSEVSDELVHVDLMIVPVDVPHVYFQVTLTWLLRQPLPLMIVHTQDYAVVLATEEVLVLWVLEGVKVSCIRACRTSPHFYSSSFDFC